MSKQVRLSQVIAIEKQVKSRTNSEGGELHKLNQKADFFNGMTRNYEKIDDKGEDLPGESKIVQARATDNLNAWSQLWKELVDVVATKDYGNTEAKADLVLDGKVIVPQVPVTHLIWLEKQLEDFRTFVDKLPTLSPDKAWKLDSGSGLHVTEPVKTARMKKVPRVITKAAATDKHPAQTEIVAEDVIAGYWVNVSVSGAMSDVERRKVLNNIDNVRKAVKQAREEGNSIRVNKVNVADEILKYILNT